MTEPKVWTFFYGSFINQEVLARVGLVPDVVEPARLPGHEILIEPLANLIRSERGMVYGILVRATHRELDRLYDYANHKLGGRYLPEAVLVETQDSSWRAALCYIAPDLNPGPADIDYIERIVKPAREYGFPEWYLTRLESFRP